MRKDFAGMSKRRKSRVSQCMAGTVLFLLLAYLLSVGPVLALTVRFQESGYTPRSICEIRPWWSHFELCAGRKYEYADRLEQFYAPLIWCAENNDLFKSGTDRYISLFNRGD